MLQFQTKRWVASTVVVFSWLGQSAPAQQLPPGTAATASDSAEATKKSAIFASKSWQEVKSGFHQWLAEQVVLTPLQVEQFKAKLDAEVKAMSAAELQQFLDQWNAKLKVLLGKDADEARAWLGQNLMVMADGYRKKFLEELGLTDIADMTASQIEEKVIEIRAKRMSMRSQREFFDTTRQKQVQYAHEVHSEWRAEAQQAAKDAGTAAQYDTYQSQYSPQPRDNYPQRYRPAYGGPFGGFGWGFAW